MSKFWLFLENRKIWYHLVYFCTISWKSQNFSVSGICDFYSSPNRCSKACLGWNQRVAKEGGSCEDGIHAHETRCDAFYQCANGHRYPDQECPEGLMYNSEKAYCDWPDNVTCPEPPTEPPTEPPQARCPHLTIIRYPKNRDLPRTRIRK